MRTGTRGTAYSRIAVPCDSVINAETKLCRALARGPCSASGARSHKCACQACQEGAQLTTLAWGASYIAPTHSVDPRRWETQAPLVLPTLMQRRPPVKTATPGLTLAPITPAVAPAAWAAQPAGPINQQTLSPPRPPARLEPPCRRLAGCMGSGVACEQPAVRCEHRASCEHLSADPKLHLACPALSFPLLLAKPLVTMPAPLSHAPLGEHIRRALRLADVVDDRAVIVGIALRASHQSRHMRGRRAIILCPSAHAAEAQISWHGPRSQAHQHSSCLAGIPPKAGHHITLLYSDALFAHVRACPMWPMASVVQVPALRSVSSASSEHGALQPL